MPPAINGHHESALSCRARRLTCIMWRAVRIGLIALPRSLPDQNWHNLRVRNRASARHLPCHPYFGEPPFKEESSILAVILRWLLPQYGMTAACVRSHERWESNVPRMAQGSRRPRYVYACFGICRRPRGCHVAGRPACARQVARSGAAAAVLGWRDAGFFEQRIERERHHSAPSRAAMTLSFPRRAYILSWRRPKPDVGNLR
jgi:hypothetical protein